jgi:ribosomal protein S18 acetylase RimI-like enzyme
MSAARIREMQAGDAEAVASMVAELNRHQGYDPALGPDAAALCRAFLGGAARGRLLVAEAAGPILAGYVTLHLNYETTFTSPGAYVGDLYVVPALRRRGIGRALLGAAARLVRAGGGDHLWWTALPGNTGGQAFYRRLGAKGEPVVAFVLAEDAFGRIAAEEERR